MMGGIFVWLILGVVLYLLLTKRGGAMGCCGGHSHHSPEHPNRSEPHIRHSPGPHEEIIDLNKEDYRVLHER